MRHLKAEILFLLVFVTDYIQTELDPDGKNVCLTTENAPRSWLASRVGKTKEKKTSIGCQCEDEDCIRKELTYCYKETVMVQVEKKKTEKRWCWRGRCSKTKLYYEDEPRVFKRTRIVAKCCDGYREEIGQTDCVPACLKGCKNGKCVAPDTCACDPGFHGLECDKECPEGRWGVNCTNKCTCSDNGKCKKEKGCECKPGWMGDRCDLPCQEGYYGNSCEKKCKCDLACNHETGECTINTITSAPPAATNYDAGTSTNGYQTTEKNQVSESEGTERNQISESEGTETSQISESEGTETSQISEPEISGRLKTKIFNEVVDTTRSKSGEDIEIEDEINSEIAAFKETKLSHSVTSMTEVTKSIREDSSAADPILKATEPFTNDFTTSTKSGEETTQKDADIKFDADNEINFLNGFETYMRNASIKDTEAMEHATEVSTGHTFDKSMINNKTFWITFTNTQQPDTDETDNLINSEKESAPKDYLNTKVHFLASLSILSGISLIIFVIAAKWVIVSHKRKVQKIIVTTQKEKMLHSEQGKSQTQNFFLVNGYAENPVYLSDVDINKAVPILQTFKPVN